MKTKNKLRATSYEPKTQLTAARAGRITPQMKRAARHDGVEAEFIRRGLAEGVIVLPANRRHKSLRPRAIGRGLPTKVNANLGTSPDGRGVAGEVKKLQVALAAGADAVMDLSLGGDLDKIRAELLRNCPLPFGSVPIYQALVDARRRGGDLKDLRVDDFFRAVEKHCLDGVDFVTLHCGVTRHSLNTLLEDGRLTGIVSRGGSMLAEWMLCHDRENPFFEYFDRLLDVAGKYDVTLSLGDGLRPGSLSDATDRPQLAELLELGRLVERCRAAGVQVMIEGPGHVPLHQVADNVVLEKKVCHGAPFYVLGPLVTDISPGYDHVTVAIGGAVAAMAGADFLCYVTPAEHLRLPNLDDVKRGVMASRVAAHAGDIARGQVGARRRDDELSLARCRLDWEGQARWAIDPALVRKRRGQLPPRQSDACSMCGEYCAMKTFSRTTKGRGKKI